MYSTKILLTAFPYSYSFPYLCAQQRTVGHLFHLVAKGLTVLFSGNFASPHIPGHLTGFRPQADWVTHVFCLRRNILIDSEKAGTF